MKFELSRKELRDLLLLEKERRGVEKDKLVFIGMADVAEYYWCAMKSFFQNKEMELAYFGSYLHDRIMYSLKLGYIDEIPKNKEQLLDIGDEITLNDIERLLAEKAENMQKSEIAIYYGPIIQEDAAGNKRMILPPDLPLGLKEEYLEIAEAEGIPVISIEEASPIMRGEILHRTKAEEYPTIRWNFPWKDYIVVGVPDGITDSFVYEFKTTRSEFLVRYTRPVAFTQADLYGYFFKRGSKRVQIYIVEKDIIKTWTEKVDTKNAEDVLYKFKRIEEGEPPKSPQKWKCKHCKFRTRCTLL